MTPTALLKFMRQHRLAVQVSVSPKHRPQAAVVGIAVTDEFEIIFDTVASSRKAANLRQNEKAALVIGGLAAGEERTVQYEGVADEPFGDVLERVVKSTYYSVYPDGPTRLSWPGLIYVRIRPEWIRYSDYNKSPPEIVEFRAADLVTRHEAKGRA